MDLLVKLYALPALAPALATQAAQGIRIHRALPPDRHLVLDWVAKNFDAAWASECAVAFARRPVACFIAREGKRMAGFACHEATCKNFFGPAGVSEAYRGRRIGTALLLACLHDMAAQGYAYAIVGGVGSVKFYEKAVGAIPIEGSDPGIYRDVIGDDVRRAHPDK